MGDLKITQSHEGLQLKQDSTKAYVMLPFIVYMLWEAVPLFFQLFPLKKVGDYVGAVFIALWLAALLGLTGYAVVRWLFVRVELNPKGIFYSDCFRKREILWCELKDYGLSRGKSSDVGRKYYCLYFSEEILAENKRYKKMHKGVIRLDVDRKDHATVLTKVIPYCRQYITATKPFIAE